jgi:AraC-like DNA-binding protein
LLVLSARIKNLPPSTSDGRNEAQSVSTGESVQIWKARKFIAENIDSYFSLGDVAKVVGLNASYFSGQFKQATGIGLLGQEDGLLRVTFRHSQRERPFIHS